MKSKLVAAFFCLLVVAGICDDSVTNRYDNVLFGGKLTSTNSADMRVIRSSSVRFRIDSEVPNQSFLCFSNNGSLNNIVIGTNVNNFAWGAQLMMFPDGANNPSIVLLTPSGSSLYNPGYRLAVQDVEVGSMDGRSDQGISHKAKEKHWFYSNNILIGEANYNGWKLGTNANTIANTAHKNVTFNPPSVSGGSDFTTNIAWTAAKTNCAYAVNISIHTDNMQWHANCTNNGTLMISGDNSSGAPVDQGTLTIWIKSDELVAD